MDQLSRLNAEQIAAVKTTEGYVRVIAGAGSGKTRALTYRYTYLVEELGISTANIACITFTNKAAAEMKKRIRAMIGDKDTGYVCTFHGLGVKILREEIHYFGWPQRSFRILDEEDQETILKRVYEELKITKHDITFKDAKKIIGDWKRISYGHIPYLRRETIDSINSDIQATEQLTEKLVLCYAREQKKELALDFDDLITLPITIFIEREEIKAKWAKRFEYVMVDEYQDVSPNNDLLCEMISSYHKNLFVVGDPDQTIYSWRGANVKHILDFDKYHSGTKTIFMSTNYRSNEGIIRAANTLIAHNRDRIPKDMIATKLSSVNSNYFHAKTVYEEAKYVSDMILTLSELGIEYSDIVILYRAHYVSQPFEQAMIRQKIPYRVVSGVPFYQRKEIKDIVAYLRFLIQEDDLDFERIINEPARGIGKSRMQLLREISEQAHISMYEALKQNLYVNPFLNTKASEFVDIIEAGREVIKDLSIADLVDSLYACTGLEDELRRLGDDDRLDNVAIFKQSVADYEDEAQEEVSLEDFLDTIALYTSADGVNKSNGVQLMTVHSAKGLEFPYVFVVGMNEGIFPSSKANSLEKLEEERRLAYVAYTRAEEELYITESEGYTIDNTYKIPSRFILNTNLKQLTVLGEPNEALLREAEEYERTHSFDQPLGLSIPRSDVQFEKGKRVKHEVFGEGIICEVKEDTNTCVILFDSSKTDRTILMTKLQLLE